MSTPLMPELPNPPSYESAYDDAPLTGHYSTSQMHAYGLAVWKAAMEAAAETCEEMRDKAISAQHGRPDDLQNVMLRQVGHVGAGACAAAIRSLPDPVIQQARLGSS